MTDPEGLFCLSNVFNYQPGSNEIFKFRGSFEQSRAVSDAILEDFHHKWQYDKCQKGKIVTVCLPLI